MAASRRPELPPISTTLESDSVEDVTDTIELDRIHSQFLNRADSIESFLSTSDVESGGEDNSSSNCIRTEGNIVFISRPISIRCSDFCLATIGGNSAKVCLNKQPCLIAAHSKHVKVDLNPGFYLRVVGRNSTSLSIFSVPLGPM